VYEHQLHHYLDDIHELFAKLIPPHKADYFRTNMLGESSTDQCGNNATTTHRGVAAKYGGVYIDSDMISMGNMRHWYDLLKYYDIVSIDWAPEGLCAQQNICGSNILCRGSTVDRCDWTVACEQYGRSKMEKVAT